MNSANSVFRPQPAGTMDCMRAFDVRRNGKRLCIAGIAGDCVLSAIVSHVAGRNGPPEVSLHVGGLISATDEHVIWRNARLKHGDEVTVRIVQTDRADRPRRKYKVDSKEAEKNAKAYVRAVAKQYGWKLITSKRR